MQKKIIMWQSWFSKVGGVETGIYNFCVNLRDYYDILVLTLGGDYKQLARLKQYVKVETIDPNKTYEADIIIRNSVWTELPKNILAPRIIEMKHANYVYLEKSGRLKDQYIKDDRVTEHLACGEFAAKMYKEYSGQKIPYIRNILAPKKKTEKIYRFLSTSRVYDPDKGWNDIIKFCDMMRAKKMKYEFTIFSELPPGVKEAPYPEIHIYEPRLDITDYIANNDYVVLFTKSEGCPFSILEALQYQTPCIVSDVGGCTELIQDGVNGYVVKDLNTFDIEKIKKIPKLKPYQGTTADEWCDYLGGAEYEKKPLYEYGKVKIQAIDDYFDTAENRQITKGTIYEVDEDRANQIIKGDYAKLCMT